MKSIIIQIGVILAIVLFLAYLAYDDRRNMREREEEDRARALEQEKEES
jgi:uncharacterized membrane protein